MAYDDDLVVHARRGYGLRHMLASAAAVVSLFLVGVAGLGLWYFQTVHREQGPARQAVESFLRQVSDGDAAGAYARLCPRTRKRMTREAFTDWLHSQPKIDKYVISEVKIVTVGGGLKGTATTRLTWDSGLIARHAMPMTHEDGRWLICGDPF